MINLELYEKIGEREGYEIFKMKDREVYAAQEPGCNPFKILKINAEGKQPIRKKEK